MPWDAKDGLLYLTVLVAAFYAYQNIPDTLNHIRNLAACPEQTGSGPRKQLQKDAENAISVDTLRLLSDGHSYDLRASTIKIVATRTVKSRTKKLLLKDLASKDEDRRYNAICATWMLLYNPALHGKQIVNEFVDYKTFYAVITALRNVLDSHRPGQTVSLSSRESQLYPESNLPPSPIKPPVRPYHETCLMFILRVLLDASRPFPNLVEHDDPITCALSAGLVSRWLKDYPFPCSLPQNSKYNYKRSDVVRLFETGAWASDDLLMAAIIHHINITAMGKKQLRDAGLRGSSYTEIDEVESTIGRWRHFPTRLDTVDSDNDVRMINGEGTAGAATPPPISTHRPRRASDTDISRIFRSQDLSPEEENLRRRRREAVVVAEPGAPFSQDNILQRTDSGSTWRRNVASYSSDELEESIGASTQPESTLHQRIEEGFQSLAQTIDSTREDFTSFREEMLAGIISPAELHALSDKMITDIEARRDRFALMMTEWDITEDELRVLADRLSRMMDDLLTAARECRSDAIEREANGTE